MIEGLLVSAIGAALVVPSLMVIALAVLIAVLSVRKTRERRRDEAGLDDRP